MKIVLWMVGIVLAIPICIFAITYLASELSGEVVTLHRTQANGDVSKVRIWIVDSNEESWIEHGNPDSHWMSELGTNPQVTLTRNGENMIYHATPDAANHAKYHQLRQQKYTWGAAVVAFFGGAAADCTGLPVRLTLQTL